MNSTFDASFDDLTILKGDKGDKGEQGADGKSAYQYAQEGGYTGTEAEFAVKMAQEIPIVDDTLKIPGQAADAAVVGKQLGNLSDEITQSIIDSYQEKDPTVPDWAKAETKPTYTAAEVGAVPESAKSDIDKNTSARHTHSNKSALDSISESDIAKWNSGTAGTVEITGATGLAAGSAPTVTEAADSTAQARKYQLGIPAGKDGADGAKGDKGETGAKGDKGEQGADGKSAYQFAQEAGYTGTETEFGAKLNQTTFANPNALTFTGAVEGSYDGSAPLTVNIPEGGGVTELTGGGWRKIATHVWDGNTEYQPLTLDYATGEMTFAEAPSTVNCVWPVTNNMNDVSAATDLSVFYSKIPKEFLTVDPLSKFSTGTNGYKFGNVSSIEEGSVNANVDISAFRFEKSGTAPSFTGLNAKRVKVRMLCPGGNFWINNGSFSFNVKLSNGQLVNVGNGDGIATSRVAYGIINQDISVGWNMLSHQYSLVIAQCKERMNQNQYFKYFHNDLTLKNKIVPDGVTITDLIFNTGNGNYWPCNGTVVEVYEFVG